MAKKGKPKTDLGKIKKQGQLFGSLREISKMPAGHPQLNPYLTYLEQEHGISKDESDTQRNLLLYDTSQIGSLLTSYLAQHQGELIQEVGKDPRMVLSKLEGQTLMQLAAPHIGDDNYKKRNAVLESGQAHLIGNTVMGLYASESWQRVVANSSSTALKDTLEKEQTRAKGKYLAKDLGLNPKTGTLNVSKATGYLAPKMKTDEDKLQIGLIYANQQ